ncbi:hypothetical protein [Streptomyces flaveolus]|uniref:hypothetical protein n=1 Tax=Streptomyces flaveolus TaxID=67297 RepID=UPI003F541E31
MKPGENAVRLPWAAVADPVLPVFAEAHDPPFAEASPRSTRSCPSTPAGDFGTDDLCPPTVTRLLTPGGRIGWWSVP